MGGEDGAALGGDAVRGHHPGYLGDVFPHDGSVDTR
jgi:hypothetical protein